MRTSKQWGIILYGKVLFYIGFLEAKQSMVNES